MCQIPPAPTSYASCQFKIDGNCKSFPNMSNSSWFQDQNSGGPQPTTQDMCSKRQSSWENSCDLSSDNIEMVYTSGDGLITPIGGYKDSSVRGLPVYLGTADTSTDVNKASQFCSQN